MPLASSRPKLRHSNHAIQTCQKRPFSIHLPRSLYFTFRYDTSMLPCAMSSLPPAFRPPLCDLRVLCVKIPTELRLGPARSASTHHSLPIPARFLEKCDLLTPLLSIPRFHSFHSLLTLFLISPVFATLTKSTPGYTPSPPNVQIFAHPLSPRHVHRRLRHSRFPNPRGPR